jgi:hypothetical protein
MVPALGLTDRGIKASGESWCIIREPHNAGIPAALIELAFISNPAEEHILTDQAAQERAAQAICEGVLAFLGLPDQTAPAAPDQWTLRMNQAAAFVKNNGFSDGLRPNDTATRAEVWAMLENLAKHQGSFI